MNGDIKEYTMDDLEDIIREYSSRPQTSAEKQDGAQPEKGDKPRVPAASDDETKRLSDDDVRVYPGSGAKKNVAAPYTTSWEPEYDTPAGAYTPQQPITFPPKNTEQLRRQKLTQNAQRQFEKLDEAAPGRLRAGILLNLILFVTAASTALLYHQVEGQRLKLMILGQVVALLLSALVGYRRLLEGVMDALHRRFRMNGLLVVTLIICWIDALLCVKNLRLPFASVFSLQMLMAQWAEYQRVQTQMSRLDTLRKATDLAAVVKNPEYYKHLPAYQVSSTLPEQIPEETSNISTPEKYLSRFCLGAVAFGGVLAVVTSIFYGVVDGIRAYAAALLAAVPASAFICFRRPAATLEKRMHKLGLVLCGWEGVKNIEKQGYYPLSHRDLFPDNHVRLNGVRFYGERNPNTVVSYVAALMKADGGSLVKPFEQLRSSRNARVCKVEELTSYPEGVGGQIDGLSVIAGTLDFIENMGVELPEVSRIPHAVYAAVNQSLCAVFAVSFTRSKSSASGLRTLCDSAYVHPVLVDCDFVMTDRFLEQKLGVDVRSMHFPDCMTRMTLEEKTPAENAPVIALATRNGLAQRAYAVTGGAALRAAWRYGAVIHMLGGGIGFLAVALLALGGYDWILTAHNLLLYGCVWMIPGVLISEWTRNV